MFRYISAVKGETSIGLGADITLQSSIYTGDSCPADCFGGNVGRLAGVARVVAVVKIGGFYEDSLTMDPDLVIWEWFSFGGVCGG